MHAALRPPKTRHGRGRSHAEHLDVTARRIVIAACAVLALVSTVTTSHDARAQAARRGDNPASFDPSRVGGPLVHLHGAARIEARAARAGSDLVLSGTLADDAGEPLVGESVLVELTRGESAQSVHFDAASAPRGCGEKAGPPIQVDDGHTVVAKADEAGRFCVKLALPVDRYAAHLASNASALLDAAKADVSIDLAARSLQLRFDPEPRVLSLDQEALVLDAVAIVDEDGAGGAGQSLLLTLTNEQGTPLGSATTNTSGRARFALDPTRVGAPGAGELRLAFAGDSATSAGSHVASVERHARVHLALDEKLAAAAPEDGIPIPVHATWRGGDVPSGAVEARLDDAPVGAGSVEQGHARVVASFLAPPSATPTGVVHLDLAYLPEAPWFETTDALTIDVPVRGPSPWRQLPLVATAAALFAFLVLGRVSRRRDVNVAPKTAEREVRVGPRIEVVRAAGEGERGWKGRIVDAHDGAPIAKARVAVEVTGFTAATHAATAWTDDEGRFALGTDAPSLAGASLVVDAPFHASLKRPLPPAGELSIALVSRRRALLDRLVEWARSRGKPFDVRPEPTPGHVRNAAGEGEVARWADAVERAAFGPTDVDAKLEEDVERLRPPKAR